MIEERISGLLSPFAVVLQNIITNILWKKDRMTSQDILDVFLQEIVSLSVPVPGIMGAQLEFPVAAAWEGEFTPGADNTLIRYASEYANQQAVLPPEMQQMRARIEAEVDGIQRRRPPTLQFRPIRFPGDETDYPLRLRTIDGTVYLAAGSARKTAFLVMFHLKSAGRSVPPQRVEEILQVFESHFLDRGYRFIRQFSQRRADIYGDDEPDRFPALDYPILRDMLSRIQAILNGLRSVFHRIESAIDTSPLSPGRLREQADQQEFDEVFSMFFWRTARDVSDTLRFPYVLTQRQVQYLNKFTEPQALALILRRFRTTFSRRVQQFRVLEGHFLAVSDRENYRHILTCLEQYAAAAGQIEAYLAGGAADKAAVRAIEAPMVDAIDRLIAVYQDAPAHNAARKEVEEFLRTLIFRFYAYQVASIEALLAKIRQGTLVSDLHRVHESIKHHQSFMVNLVFAAHRYDVLGLFMNHPFTKYIQHTSAKLIGNYEQFKAGDDEAFYPRFLNLFQYLFFANRFFMYPVYQYDAPLMMCGFSADYYGPVQHFINSILEKSTYGIFSSIIEFELAETQRQFTEKFNRRAIVSEEQLLHFIEHRLRHLVFHFCIDPVNFQSLPFQIGSPADGDGCEWMEIPGIDRQIGIPLGDPAITGEPHGRAFLRLYLNLYRDIFAQFMIFTNYQQIKMLEWEQHQARSFFHHMKRLYAWQGELMEETRPREDSNAYLLLKMISHYLSLVFEWRQNFSSIAAPLDAAHSYYCDFVPFLESVLIQAICMSQLEIKQYRHLPELSAYFTRFVAALKKNTPGIGTREIAAFILPAEARARFFAEMPQWQVFDFTRQPVYLNLSDLKSYFFPLLSAFFDFTRNAIRHHGGAPDICLYTHRDGQRQYLIFAEFPLPEASTPGDLIENFQDAREGLQHTQFGMRNIAHFLDMHGCEFKKYRAGNNFLRMIAVPPAAGLFRFQLPAEAPRYSID